MNVMASLIGAAALVAFGATSVAAECVDTSGKSAAMKDAGSGPTSGSTGATTTGEAKQRHEATEAMDKTMGERAASPRDVRDQTAGKPTAAQRAEGKKADC